VEADPLRLSCVVPATNDPRTLERCLAAIEAAERGPDEVVVVTEPAPSGPAEARNRGWREATGDVIVFVDADVLVHPDCFARIRGAFAADPRLTGVFGSYDDEPEAPGTVSVFRNLLHHHVHQQGAGAALTFWAGLGAVRREALEGVGGFDAERYPRPSIEDVELGMRLSDAGCALRLDPLLRGTHLKRWTLAEMVRSDYADRGLPWSRLLLRSRAGLGSRSLNLGWRHRLSALASVAVLAGLVLRRPRAALLALGSLLALNSGFYALLLRKRGPGEAAAGVGLHVVHHLAGTAAAGTAAAEAAGLRPRPQPASGS
jgi:glycosyltransferase involved in cell wall biosynthesis